MNGHTTLMSTRITYTQTYIPTVYNKHTHEDVYVICVLKVKKLKKPTPLIYSLMYVILKCTNSNTEEM